MRDFRTTISMLVGIFIVFAIFAGYGLFQYAMAVNQRNQSFWRLMRQDYGKPNFGSEGERIYLTGKNASGERIVNSVGPRMGLSFGCANCHRPSGRGGIFFPDGSRSSDIRWKKLGRDYTNKTLERAVVRGINREPRPMSPFMPRWKMTQRELRAVIEYLKTL